MRELRVNEIHLALDGNALRALAEGAELALEIDETRIYLSCDAETVNLFQRAVLRALLHQLPAGEQRH